MSIKFPPISKYLSNSLKLDSLSIAPRPIVCHLSPIFAAPSWSGDTRTEALGLRTRYLPKGVWGRGGRSKIDMVLAQAGDTEMRGVLGSWIFHLRSRASLCICANAQVLQNVSTIAKYPRLLSASRFLLRSCCC